jgi:cytidylate kinase
MGFIVAVDGPAGSGKGTITKIVSERMNLVSIDTGAMYRCVALDCLNNEIDSTDLDGIENILNNIKIELKNEDGKQKVLLNGKDVSEEIRTAKVDNAVAKYAAVKIIRDKVTPMQRKMGETQNIIMEGRDIGTVVFPNADVKIFLDCSVEERARRRYKQNLEKGINETFEEVLSNIKERHRLETEREVAPFVKAEDAIYIDSSNMTIEEVSDKIIEIIKQKMNKR